MFDEDLIIRVARSMCVADGNAPEAPIAVGFDDLDQGADWNRQLPTMAPAWIGYVGEARRLIAAMKELGVLKA